eukprot:TRINITY_DN11401_c0_g1_i1.p1 TRINITY_DN11401_c0_g1~~TRINITY_DN11401_c0_g1_i1.p1  ORF type:complete len:879 (+),score=121.36 TRINITY_DN11401_c0_g1_i1:104-2638(+)
MGVLTSFDEDLLMKFLVEIKDTKVLGRLCCCSKQLRFYCLEEPMWMRRFFKYYQGKFEYCGSWRATYLMFVLKIEQIPQVNMSPNLLPRTSLVRSQSHGRWQRRNMHISQFAPAQNSVPSINNSDIRDGDRFCESYDGETRQPVLIKDAMQTWKMMDFDLIDLVDVCGENVFPVQSPIGCDLRMDMKSYLGYMTSQRDEEPLYIFNDEFGENVPELLESYEVPQIFKKDLFNYLGKQVRPEYRWFVVGPERSGARWHVDPTCTSAWNALVMGHKRWALYPPNKIPAGLEIQIDEDGDVDFDSPSSLQWFLEIYPYLSADQKPLEILQNPGEIIFVPGGWWHCVLNLDITVAITQNFVSWHNFENVVKYMSCGGGQFICDQAEIHNPKLQVKDTKYQKGYLKNAELGKWLRKLTVEFPDRRNQVREIANKWLNQEQWTDLLMRILNENEIEFGDDQIVVDKGYDFPIRGKVFVVGSKSIKLFFNQNLVYEQFLCLIEFLSLKTIDLFQTLEIQQYSKLFSGGLIDVNNQIIGIQNQKVPYLILGTVIGEDIITCFNKPNFLHQNELCEQFGQVVSSIHKTDKMSTEQLKTIISQGNQQLFKFFNDLIVTQLGDEQYGSQQKTTFWKTNQGHFWFNFIGHVSIKKDGSIKVRNDVEDREKLKEWYPFISYLRWLRVTVVERQSFLQCLPQKMIDQIDGYIPQDPVTLLYDENGQISFQAPMLCHGDLTFGNVLIDAKNNLGLIDFGDSGYGDVLYDFLAVFVSSLQCKQDWFQRFFKGYGQTGVVSLKRQQKISKVCMCYSLLHEENVLGRALKVRKEFRGLETLEQLEESLWGFLDDYVTSMDNE